MRRAGHDTHHSAFLASSRSIPHVSADLWDVNSNKSVQSPIRASEKLSDMPEGKVQSKNDNDNALYFGGPEHVKWLAAVYGVQNAPSYRRKIRVSGLFSS